MDHIFLPLLLATTVLAVFFSLKKQYWSFKLSFVAMTLAIAWLEAEHHMPGSSVRMSIVLLFTGTVYGNIVYFATRYLVKVPALSRLFPQQGSN